MPTGYWANMPKFMVSYLKSMYGDAATTENEFGYDWHPKILGDHSHMPMFAAMNAGKVKGMICIGQNPATSLNAKLERAALRKLEWLVVKDNWLTETATFWKNAPEVKNGEVKTAGHQDRSVLLPGHPGRRDSKAPSPTPSGCCSSTTRPPSRRAIAGPTRGSTTSSASA